MAERISYTKQEIVGGGVGALGTLLAIAIPQHGSYDRAWNIDRKINSLHTQIKGIHQLEPDAKAQTSTSQINLRFLDRAVATRKREITSLAQQKPNAPTSFEYASEMLGGALVAGFAAAALVNKLRFARHRRQIKKLTKAD